MFLQSINTQFQILGSALCQLREVPSQLTGAPQSNDWREVAGAQGLFCRGRNGARSKVPGGAAVKACPKNLQHSTWCRDTVYRQNPGVSHDLHSHSLGRGWGEDGG